MTHLKLRSDQREYLTGKNSKLIIKYNDQSFSHQMNCSIAIQVETLALLRVSLCGVCRVIHLLQPPCNNATGWIHQVLIIDYTLPGHQVRYEQVTDSYIHEAYRPVGV